MKTIALFLVFMLSAVSVFAADAAPVAAEVPAPAPLPMERVTAQSIVRLSRVRVDPAHLEEYLVAAKACGAASMEKEPGVLLMYSMQEKEKPEQITILEIYETQAAYEAHIRTEHFQAYKQGTLPWVLELELLDQIPLFPNMRLKGEAK